MQPQAMQTQTWRQIIHQFQHRDVRDLAWVIASPPLVSGDHDQVHWWDHTNCLREFENCLPALRRLDDDPEPLHSYLENLKSRRLGLRFEALVAFWLDRISPDYTLLAHNIALRETVIDETGRLKRRTQVRTLGELDFIIRDTQRQSLIHLEVAVKFYLGTHPLNDPYRWFGTDTRDRLGNKLDHLKQRQTRYSIRFHKQLEALGYRVDERHCLLKGRLFYPLEHSTTISPSEWIDPPAISPAGIAPGHLTARWTYPRPPSSKDHWVKLKKTEWFGELSDSDIRAKTVLDECAALDVPTCFACVSQDENQSQSDNDSRKWHETGRLFCLPSSFRFPERD